jgi:signal transduction histidine kinase
MLGLRGKLLLGFGGLLFILLGVSLLGNTVLNYYSGAMRRMLGEDLDGIKASQRISDAVGTIDQLLESSLAGADHTGGAATRVLSREGTDPGARLGPGAPSAAPDGTAAAEDPPASDFRRQSVLAEIQRQAERVERNLSLQVGGQTLPDEREVTTLLSELWEQYRRDYPRLLGNGLTPAQRRDLYAQTLAPQATQIQAAAADIFHINANNMQSNSGEAGAIARSAQFAMHALTLCGAVLASAFALLLGRIIIGPIRTLTESVQQVRQGNLDLEVPVRSQDELGRLGEAFNEMASQLRVFRRIDHEKLIRSQRTTQLAIDSLPDAVVVINPQGGLELTNETAKRLFDLHPGVPVDSLPDKRLAELHRRAWRGDSSNGKGNGSAAAMGGLAGPGAAGFGSSIKVEDDGHDRFFLPRSAPIVDEQRNTVGLTIVLADITDFRRLDEMKNSLLATVSHELKTPLTSIRMILHLVVEQKVGPLTPRQRELLVAAREDSDRLHEIVENLLDMGRIESGKALMELRPADALGLVRGCVEPLRPAFAEKGVALYFDPPAAAPAVLADSARVRHVFDNLLGNALRYTPPGESVRVGLREALDGVEFTVSDTGPGIPHEYLHRVFEKFFRVPGQPGESGAGLGLAIVKDIIEAHGGSVTVESAPGQGTTFRFTLRAARSVSETGRARRAIESNGDAETGVVSAEEVPHGNSSVPPRPRQSGAKELGAGRPA